MKYQSSVSDSQSISEIKELVNILYVQLLNDLSDLRNDIDKVQNDQIESAKRLRKDLSKIQSKSQKLKAILIDYQKVRKQSRTTRKYI